MEQNAKVLELKTILYLIAKGFYQKSLIAEMENKTNKYPHSPILRHGLNKLLAFAMVNNCKDRNNGKIIAPLDETDAIVNYFSKPVSEWMGKWPEDIKNIAQSSFLYDWDNLVDVRENSKYIITEFCEELSDVYRIVETELEQEMFYRSLKKLGQSGYVLLRRYVIDKNNRVIKKDVLNRQVREIGLQLGKVDEVKETLKNAYEAWGNPYNSIYICNGCGWTLNTDKSGRKSCHDKRCRKATNDFKDIEHINDTPDNYFRLKKGIMQFISNPGTLEVELEKKCKELGLETEMWPDMDTYDVKILFSNGKYLAIDIKDYSRPFLLKDKIEQDALAIHDSGWEHGFIVVPDDRVKENRNYCDIVNRGINSIGQGNKVKCIKYTDLIKYLKERAVEV